MPAHSLRPSTHASYPFLRVMRPVSKLWTPDDPEYYPSSDGEPMAENTLHYIWIVTLHESLCVLFMTESDVFIASDLLWYPVKGSVFKRRAPDCMVVFGRPKRETAMIPSYLQWEEENIPPQVVIEVRSQSDTTKVLDEKFNFYQEYGVEEYLLLDPSTKTAQAWLREGKRLIRVTKMAGWQSPHTGLRFEKGGDFNILLPDGTPIVQPSKATHEAQQLRLKAEKLQKKAERLQKKAEKQQKEEQKLRMKEEQRRQEAEKLQKQERKLRMEERKLRMEERKLRMEEEQRRQEAEMLQKQEQSLREQAEAKYKAELEVKEALMAKLQSMGIDLNAL